MLTMKATKSIVGSDSLIILRNSPDLMFRGTNKRTKKTLMSPKRIIAHLPNSPEKYRLRMPM